MSASNHIVKNGECMSSIARRYGFAPDALWKHAANDGLREARADPNLLKEGDIVSIPERDPKHVPVEAGGTYKFQLVNTHARLRLRIQLAGAPLQNEPYVVKTSKQSLEGTTDGDGMLDENLPANETSAEISLPERGLSFVAALGELDPADTPAGAAQRLRNLGYFTAVTPEGDLGFGFGLRRFQHLAELPETGELDDATVDALRERHGC